MSPTRLAAVARKETLQLARDRRSLLLAFLLPLLLLVVFGYAITWDVRDVPMALLDGDRSPRSRELVDAFRASGTFVLVADLDAPREIRGLLDRGDVTLVLVVPRGLAADLAAGRPATVQAIVDGSDANTATIALGHARGVVHGWSRRVDLRAAAAAPPAVAARSRVWFNEELSSRTMIVPGLVAVIMMIIAALLTSLTISREWERGTMEQLAATPVTRLELVLGKLAPYVAVGLVDVVAVSVVGVWLFDVPFRGSPALLMVLSFFYLLGALGLGMFISAAARSQVVATQVAMVATFLPAFLLSGFMFALDAMPAALRAVTLLVPARYFLVVTRGIFLKGVGIEVLRVQGLLMVAFAAVGLGLAVAVFRKEIG